MEFGLGLILSFTDNATVSINSAINSLNTLTSVAESASSSLGDLSNTASLSALSFMADSVGTSFLNMGETIIGTFSQIISKINSTGQTMKYAEAQLSKLYENSGKTGKDVLNDINEYAKKSTFNFENLIPVVTMLKGNGIEAFEEISSSSGKSIQTLMDYASDLAAFNPEMRNAYGTGIQAAMGALSEYIAEGNAMSLKRGASLDITSILGEEKGSTVEERSRQIADLLEQLNMVGMTASLANTPMQKLSNMGDILFQTIAKISESGVYDKFTEIIGKLADYVFAIPDEELTQLAQIVGDALVTIMSPLEKVVDIFLSFIDVLRETVKTNPQLVRLGTIITAVAGAVLLLSGIALKSISSLASLILIFNNTGISFATMGKAFKLGVMNMLSFLAPLVLITTLLYTGWKKDFGGIRTTVTDFVTNVINSFKTAREAVDKSVPEMLRTFNKMNGKGTFFGNLTYGFMQVIQLFKSLSDYWGDNKLTEENYFKSLGLGILPLIETIIRLKTRFETFKKGFVLGWGEISRKVKNAISEIIPNFKGDIFKELTNYVTKFLEKFSKSNLITWFEFGESFAEITAKALVFFSALGAGFLALKAFNLTSILKSLTSLGSVFTILGGFGTKIGTMLLSALPTILTALGVVYMGIFNKVVLLAGKLMPLLGSVIVKVISSVTPLLAKGLSTFIPVVGGFLSKILTTLAPVLSGALSVLFSKIGPLFSAFLGKFTTLVTPILGKIGGIIISVLSASIGGIPVALILAVVAGITAVIALVSNNKDKISEVFKSLWDKIPEPIQNVLTKVLSIITNTINAIIDKLGIRPQIEAVLGFFKDILPIVVMIGNGVISAVKTVVNWIVTLFNNFLLPIISTIITSIKSMWDSWIKDLVMNIAGFVARIIAIVTPIITWLIDNVVPIITIAIQGLIKGITSIINVVGSVASALFGICNGIIDFFVGIFTGNLDLAWQGICSIFTNAFEGVKSVWGGIFEYFSGIIDTIKSMFSKVSSVVAETITNVVKSAINSVISRAVGLINGFINGINSAIKFINKIPGVNLSTIEQLEVPQLAQGGIVDKPTLSVIGEAGKEAVMPLENNTDWIDSLAGKISYKIDNRQSINTDITPIVDLLKIGIDTLNNLSITPIFNDERSKAEIPVVNLLQDKYQSPMNNTSFIKAMDLVADKVVSGVSKFTLLFNKDNTELNKVTPIYHEVVSGSTTNKSDINNITNNNQEHNYITNNNNAGEKYITHNTNKTSNVQQNPVEVDRSVTFAQGSIVINANGVSDAECENMAKKIMEFIKRQQEIDEIFNYG